MRHSKRIHNILRQYYCSGLRGFYTLNRLLNSDHYPELLIENSFGACFSLHPSRYIDSVILKEGYYESEVLEALKSYVSPTTIFWDIGANFGLHGISMKVLYPEIQVFLFEPLPKMAQKIRHNAELNGVELSVIEAGLLDINDSLPLFTEQSQTEGESSFLDHGREKLTTHITATCHRADTLISGGELPLPNIVKIDVEGAEARTLAGFGEYLSSEELKAIVFEASATVSSSSAESPIPDLLHQNGFKMRKLTRRERTEHDLENFLAYRNN